MSIKRSDETIMQTQSRQVYKQQKKQNKESVPISEHAKKQQRLERKQAKKKTKRPRRRIFPIWLRLIFVLVCAVGALVAGLMIGFGVIGDGDPNEVLNRETWEHIMKFIKPEE